MLRRRRRLLRLLPRQYEPAPHVLDNLVRLVVVAHLRQPRRRSHDPRLQRRL